MAGLFEHEKLFFTKIFIFDIKIFIVQNLNTLVISCQ